MVSMGKDGAIVDAVDKVSFDHWKESILADHMRILRRLRGDLVHEDMTPPNQTDTLTQTLRPDFSW